MLYFLVKLCISITKHKMFPIPEKDPHLATPNIIKLKKKINTKHKLKLLTSHATHL